MTAWVSSDEFHFRWLVKRVSFKEIEKAQSISLMFNHLNWNPPSAGSSFKNCSNGNDAFSWSWVIFDDSCSEFVFLKNFDFILLVARSSLLLSRCDPSVGFNCQSVGVMSDWLFQTARSWLEGVLVWMVENQRNLCRFPYLNNEINHLK